MHRESLARHAGLPVTRHLPGHGEPFDDLAPILDKYERITARRRGALIQAAESRESVYAVSKRLFGGRADVVTLLTVGETLFTAIELEREGRARIQTSAGPLTTIETSGDTRSPPMNAL